MAALLTLTVLAGFGLFARLSYSPIETSVPQSLLDRVVAEAAPGWRVEAGGAQLDFSSNDGLNGLKLRDVTFSDPSGKQVVSAPLLGLRFDLTATLDPYAALSIREVALRGASVDVTRNAKGTFQLDIGEVSSGAGDFGGASVSDLGNLDDLPRLRIEDAKIQYTDLARGATWRTENARLTLDPSATGLSGSLSLQVDGGIGAAQLEAFHASDSGQVTAKLTLTDVRPSRVAQLDPLLAPLARIDAPLSGVIDIAASDGGTFEMISADLTAREGTVDLLDGPTALDSFAAAFSCDIASKSCDVSNLAIATDAMSGAFHGTVQRRGETALALDLTVDRAAGHADGIEAQIAQGTASATFETETGLLKLDNAQLSDLMLTGLPNETSLRLGRVATSGTYAAETGQLTLPRFAAEMLRVSDASGTEKTLAAATGSLVFDGAAQRLSVSDLGLTQLAALIDGNALTIAQVDAAADVNLADNTVALTKASLTDLRVKPAAGAPAQIASASITGSVDVAAQKFTNGAIALRGAVLSIPDLYDTPISIEAADVALAAHVENGATRLTLKGASAKIDGLPVSASGNFALRADGTALGRVEASLGPILMAKVPAHWPNGVAPGGKRWVAANVSSGISDKLTVTAQFDEAHPDKDALDLKFTFRDATVSFAPGMPPIRGGKGVGKATLDRFDLNLAAGSVTPSKGAALTVSDSTFAISDFAPDIPNAQVQLRAAGPVKSVLRLLDTEPLGVISPTGFDIDGASGNADVRVLLDLPLAADLLMDDVIFDARAKIHEYGLKEPKTGLAVEGDVLLVKADGEGLTLQSDARIDGMTARLGYSQAFAKPKEGEPESTLTLNSFLSLADFARHGLVLDEYLEGLTAMKARIDLYQGGFARINADADLTNVRLKADRLDWAKPAGVPATLKLAGFRNSDGAGRIEAIELRGEGVSADGSVGFDANGTLSRADFSRIVLGSVVDAGLTYGRKTNGDIGILLRGAQLDLRRAFAEALEGSGKPQSEQAAPAGPLTDISIQIGRAFLRDDLGVFDLQGGLRLRGNTLHAANITGKLNGSASTKLLAERNAGGMAIRLTAPDAGAFIRATDIFSGAYDGALVLDAQTRDTVTPSQVSGRILIENIVLHDAPTLRKVLSGGAIASLMRDLADGGIGFTKIELPFKGVGPQWQIEDGVAFGPALGLTLEGGYNVTQNNLALTGSVSPAYAINGALGNVPILGKLLTGGEGEGLFGVTFSVSGDTKKPVVNVNPLSALAPGFLRKIVAEVGKATTANPPSAN